MEKKNCEVGLGNRKYEHSKKLHHEDILVDTISKYIIDESKI